MAYVVPPKSDGRLGRMLRKIETRESALFARLDCNEDDSVISIYKAQKDDTKYVNNEIERIFTYILFITMNDAIAK